MRNFVLILVLIVCGNLSSYPQHVSEDSKFLLRDCENLQNDLRDILEAYFNPGTSYASIRLLPGPGSANTTLENYTPQASISIISKELTTAIIRF